MRKGEPTGIETPEMKEAEKNPLEGEYREAWGRQFPNPELEIYIDRETGEVHGSDKDKVKVRKDDETDEWVIVPASNKVNDWGGDRVSVGSGESNIFLKFKDSELSVAQREWSVWKKAEGSSGIDFPSYSHEGFEAGERGEKTFTDLQSAVDYILDREDAYELRSGEGNHRGKKPFTGPRELSNSFNFGMVIEGKNSGKKMEIGNCARVGSTQLRAVLESQHWYTKKTDKGGTVMGKLSEDAPNNKGISTKLEDNEVAITFFRSNP